MADESMQKLNKYLLLRDQVIPDGFKFDDAAFKFILDISQMNLKCFEGLFVPYINRLHVYTSAKRFMREKFRLHPVRYLNESQLNRFLNKAVINDPFELPEIYDHFSTFIDPFHIPRKYDLSSIYGGRLVEQIVFPDVDDETLFELLKILNFYFQKIRLPEKLTPIATMSYAHEIAHSQLESQRGIIESYYNREVISIFVELLQAYENDSTVFKMAISDRVNHSLQLFVSIMSYKNDRDNSHISDAAHHKNIGYFISSVEAFKIFYLYLSGNQNNKTFILDEIQRVFDGEFTVEEMLNHLGTTYEESLDSSYASKLVKIAQQK